MEERQLLSASPSGGSALISPARLIPVAFPSNFPALLSPPFLFQLLFSDFLCLDIIYTATTVWLQNQQSLLWYELERNNKTLRVYNYGVLHLPPKLEFWGRNGATFELTMLNLQVRKTGQITANNSTLLDTLHEKAQ